MKESNKKNDELLNEELEEEVACEKVLIHEEYDDYDYDDIYDHYDDYNTYSGGFCLF